MIERHSGAGLSRSTLQRPIEGRVAVFISCNAVFALLLVLATALGGSDNPRAVYLGLLFGVCSLPFALAEKSNGPHAILLVFMPFYFVIFGLADLAGLFPALQLAPPSISTGILSRTEILVLAGGAALLAGFCLFCTTRSEQPRALLAADWPLPAIIGLGLAMWVSGIITTWIWQAVYGDIRVVPDISALEGMAFTLGRMVQPLGVAVLSYGAVRYRRRSLWLLVITILAIEFVFGFIANSKELSIRGMIMLLMAKHLLDGRIPKAWLIAATVGVVLSFGVFQAYRLEILQVREQSVTAAAQDIGKNLDIAVNSSAHAGGFAKGGVSAFIARISLKQMIELITARVGVDVPYEGGHTLALLFSALVPRMFWPEKPDASIGQVFNKQFRISGDRETYVAATHLGELYWNFGWVGGLGGMALIGALWGWLGRRLDLSEHCSMTRFLLLLSTIYLLGIRFEGGIALQYVVWLRSVALLLLLHALLARRAGAAPAPAAQESRSYPLPRADLVTEGGILTGAEWIARMRANRS